MSTPTRDTAVSVSESTFLRDNMVCHLDTVTYVSAEHGEKETVVEVCEPYVAPEPKDCTQSSQEREPESQVFISRNSATLSKRLSSPQATMFSLHSNNL